MFQLNGNGAGNGNDNGGNDLVALQRPPTQVHLVNIRHDSTEMDMAIQFQSSNWALLPASAGALPAGHQLIEGGGHVSMNPQNNGNFEFDGLNVAESTMDGLNVLVARSIGPSIVAMGDSTVASLRDFVSLTRSGHAEVIRGSRNLFFSPMHIRDGKISPYFNTLGQTECLLRRGEAIRNSSWWDTDQDWYTQTDADGNRRNRVKLEIAMMIPKFLLDESQMSEHE